MDLYFSPVAQAELDDAFAYLEGEQPGLGYRFTADVDEALGRIQMYPLAICHKDSATAPSLAPLILTLIPRLWKDGDPQAPWEWRKQK